MRELQEKNLNCSLGNTYQISKIQKGIYYIYHIYITYNIYIYTHICMYAFQSQLGVSKEIKRLYLTWDCNVLPGAKWQIDGLLHAKSNQLAIAVWRAV